MHTPYQAGIYVVGHYTVFEIQAKSYFESDLQTNEPRLRWDSCNNLIVCFSPEREMKRITCVNPPTRTFMISLSFLKNSIAYFLGRRNQISFKYCRWYMYFLWHEQEHYTWVFNESVAWTLGRRVRTEYPSRLWDSGILLPVYMPSATRWARSLSAKGCIEHYINHLDKSPFTKSPAPQKHNYTTQTQSNTDFLLIPWHQ